MCVCVFVINNPNPPHTHTCTFSFISVLGLAHCFSLSSVISRGWYLNGRVCAQGFCHSLLLYHIFPAFLPCVISYSPKYSSLLCLELSHSQSLVKTSFYTFLQFCIPIVYFTELQVSNFLEFYTVDPQASRVFKGDEACSVWLACQGYIRWTKILIFLRSDFSLYKCNISCGLWRPVSWFAYRFCTINFFTLSVISFPPQQKAQVSDHKY